MSLGAKGGGGGGGGGGAQGGGGASTGALPLVGGPGGDTSGALAGEDGGRAGGKGGGRAGGKGGGGGGGMLGRGRTVAATPCASEASPSLGDAEGLNGPLIVLVGSRGEGAREPGPCPVLPPESERSSELAQWVELGETQGCGRQ